MLMRPLQVHSSNLLWSYPSLRAHSQKAIPSTVSQAANKPLTFAEPNCVQHHLNTRQQRLDLHYFGPAAHIRAEQLAAEATVQSNDDGIEYSGPVDNDSARAKAAGHFGH